MASGSAESDDGASSFKVAEDSSSKDSEALLSPSRLPGPHLTLEGQLQVQKVYTLGRNGASLPGPSWMP